jgi:transcriptional regulator with XRE-family HTH domain
VTDEIVLPEQPEGMDRPEFYRRLARAMRVLRAERGLERKDLALRAGISYQYLSEIESGKKRPSSNALLAIARAFELRPHELLARVEAVEVAPRPTQSRFFHASRSRLASAETVVDYGPEPAPSGPPPDAAGPDVMAAPVARAPVARVPQAPPTPSAPSPERQSPMRPPSRLEPVLRELAFLLERMRNEDVDRLLDLARRLAR